MNFKQFDEQTKNSIRIFSWSGSLVVLFYVLINHISDVWPVVMKGLTAVSPFLLGLVLMFIMEPVRNSLENKVLEKTGLRMIVRRRIAAVICLLIILVAVGCFFAVLIPQLAASLNTLINSIDGYIRTIRGYIEQLNLPDEAVSSFIQSSLTALGEKVTAWLTGAEGGLSQILSYSISFAKGIMNFFIGIIIALYLLLDEEKFKRQVKSLIYGVLPTEAAENTTELLRLLIRTFNSFVFGKFVDSLIIGVICYFSCILMRMPYSPLIGFVIGITNMIPVFGPFIGAIPCILILLIISPLKALEFSIFIIILQQVDGNIIGPRILGDAVGLPTMWVMFAIIIGGALFGIPGMFAGVPVFSVIYVLIRDWIYRKLREKKINIERV